MPVHVEHRPVKGPEDWAIVEKSGKVVGRSTQRKKHNLVPVPETHLLMAGSLLARSKAR